jgi:L-iditol 2-dehydrogenase
MPPRLGAYAEPMAAALAVCKAGLQKTDRGLLCGGGRIAELTARVLCAHGFAHVSRWDPSSPAPPPPRDAFDFAIETQATAPVLAALVHAVRPGGRIVFKSRPHAPVPLDIHAAVRKELSFAAVCYAPFPDALALLASGQVPVEDLLGPAFPLPDFAAAFARAEESEAAKVFLLPQADEGA